MSLSLVQYWLNVVTVRCQLLFMFNIYPMSQHGEECWMFSAASFCSFVNTITSEGVNIGVGALYKNLDRVRISGP